MNLIAKKLPALLLAVILAVCSPLSAFAADDGVEEAPVSEAAASSVTQKKQSNPKADILNSAELDPQEPQSPDLAAYLDELMPELINDDMDTYEKIKACYDYVKNNTKYGSHLANLDAKIGDTTCRAIDRKYGSVEGYGAVALVARVGMCNAYASAFILMARKIGLDAYLVTGSTKSRGGYAYHEWCEIKIGGTAYVFDPQLDQSLKKSGLKEYLVFCATYDQISGRYIKY